MTRTSGSRHSFDNHSDDDDSSTGSLLVSPTKTIETSCWGGGSEPTEMVAIHNNYNFKNPNGNDDHDRTDDADNKNRTTMDVTFQDSIDMSHRKEQDDSFLFETAAAAAENATTPAKQRFSYAAAMEQLDDSWLAPTPKRPGNCDDGLDLTMEDDEEEDVGKCLEEQFTDSPIKDELLQDDIIEEMPCDESILSVTKDEEDNNAISSPPEFAALVPAPKHSSPTVATTATAALLNTQNDSLSPPTQDSSTAEADTTSAIFRHHPKNNPQQTTAASSNMMMTLQHGHPVNESYDSVEQRKQHLEQETNCISSFLVDRDRVENDIVMTTKRVGDESMSGAGDEVGGGEELNNSMLGTLEEEDEENDELSIDDDDDEERYFNNSVLETLEEHSDEAELTMTQTADCTADSDGFLMKIEHAENDEEDLVVHSYEDAVDKHDVLNQESVVAEEVKEGHDEPVGESHLTNPSEEMAVEKNITLPEDENAEKEDKEEVDNRKDAHDFAPEINLTNPEPPTDDEKGNDNDMKGTTPEYHLSSPVSPAVMQEATSSVIESSEIGVAPTLEGEDIIENKPELTSSRVDSLAFSTSADTEDALELSQQAQNTSQSSEENGNTEKLIDSNVNLTLAAPEGDAVNGYLEYSTSNQPSSEVEAGADLSFDGNSLSASLDVSLSNIDREALFAGSLSHQLSPIRQNSSSPHDLSQRQDDDLKGDEIQLPATLDTSPISGSSSPHDCQPLLGAGGLYKSSGDEFAVGAGGSLEDSPATSPTTDGAEVNKGSIFAVLSQLNTGASSNKVVQGTSPKTQKNDANEENEILSGPSLEGNPKEHVTEDTNVEMEDHKTRIETFADKHGDFQNTIDDELDERNKSLEDLSSYQQSFNSTSSAFLERLRGAAESRKREVTKARFSMERKEQILYEEKEDREVMPTLSEVTEEMVDEPIGTTTVTKTQVKPFKARPLPSSTTAFEPKGYSHSKSTSTIGSKRKSTNALRPHIHDNKPFGTNSAISAKPPKRLLSGEDASKAKEMTRRRLLQEEEERIRREAVFRARPLPASTLPRAGSIEQQTRMSHNSKGARAGKENSAFKPSSSSRAEERAAYNAEKKAREEARRQEQIRKRNALINETNEEIEKLKRFLR
ncbi:hypothetical protein QTG54_003411 [Skeletonema marinoi]|uniref:Uncharacterized protein n=1 Tax=Skeletonema marinoi TaxID=267567 RepID=A0AAD8YG47_9STRA|nr:hypothetical protein QTG54_003411 [Skeletonema marinoi]